MNISKRLVGRLKGRLLSFLVTKRSFTNRFLDRLNEIRPDDLACKANPNLVVEACRDRVIDIVVREYGDEVLDSMSDSQHMAALKRMCETHFLDVISTINSISGGSFKYVGNGDVRVIVGSGAQRMEGWLATDINQLNIVEDSSWGRLFNPGSIDRILAEHVLEHLTMRELGSALRHIYKYLRPGGIFRLAVPDAFHPSRYYYNLVKPGGWETPYEHLLFLDHEILSRIGSETGFEVRLLEYFDEHGFFHDTSYRNEDGIVQRCARNNSGLNASDEAVMTQFHASIPEHLRQQFVERQMSYTSLIADLVKPR
ncbi:methyltransferase domain-containing protein [Betaproteobacteria bacterium SCN1]|jgi:predicted SAM-dependent methyltransferase|nr:methyltransferase domain-containing protein [Betaproteobacteria bacterium SCN1]MBN8759967.1 methyltransferase domain-containing protein [Thiobacillus sp.]ODU90894.1 MAG: hypothetical protein ABT21_02425 [Thiobacillus sp. SCN 65-179]OJW35680.1 MAG: hypothetical protein BGO61_06775 [Thiobacillus sp. 65-69]